MTLGSTKAPIQNFIPNKPMHKEREEELMKKTMSILLLCFAAVTLFAGVASAHVTVYPSETSQGSYEKFTVRVPSEKDIATVKVEVKIPAEAEISRFEPKPGWKYDLTKDAASGKITSVLWTAEGSGLTSTEFGEFNMQGKVGSNASQIVWKAYQTYQDGSVVEWTGAPGSDKPASVTQVKAKPAGASADSHGNGAGPGTTGTPGSAETAKQASSQAPLYLSIAALVLGAGFGRISCQKSEVNPVRSEGGTSRFALSFRVPAKYLD